MAFRTSVELSAAITGWESGQHLVSWNNQQTTAGCNTQTIKIRRDLSQAQGLPKAPVVLSQFNSWSETCVASSEDCCLLWFRAVCSLWASCVAAPPSLLADWNALSRALTFVWAAFRAACDSFTNVYGTILKIM